MNYWLIQWGKHARFVRAYDEASAKREAFGMAAADMTATSLGSDRNKANAKLRAMGVVEGKKE